MSDDDIKSCTFQEVGETWGTAKVLGNGVPRAPSLPKTCAACGRPWPLLCLRCGACNAILCRGEDDHPWICFIRHCAAAGDDDAHRGKEATVYDYPTEKLGLPT